MIGLEVFWRTSLGLRSVVEEFKADILRSFHGQFNGTTAEAKGNVSKLTDGCLSSTAIPSLPLSLLPA